MLTGSLLLCVYGRETKADADIAHVLTMDEARRIASNIAKLPVLGDYREGASYELQSSNSSSRTSSRVVPYQPAQSGRGRKGNVPRCSDLADLDPDEWELPPKPKRMRWSTYNRFVERFDAYEEILESGIPELMAKLLGKKI